jgi:hypothetical protein
MLVVIGGFGLLAILVLGGMARKYQSVLDKGDAPISQRTAGGFQEERVDRFVKVRRAVRQALTESAGNEGEVLLARLRLARDTELRRVGMTRRGYLEVRSDWTRWRRDAAAVPAVTAQAFEKHRPELESLDLGDYESLDF